MVLAEELELEADDQEGLVEYLERRVADATRRAMRGAPPSAAATLPLVRLRVRQWRCMLEYISSGRPSRRVATQSPCSCCSPGRRDTRLTFAVTHEVLTMLALLSGQAGALEPLLRSVKASQGLCCLVSRLSVQSHMNGVRPTHTVLRALLQVDYTGFSTINVQRFGQKFVGKVANPHDVLLWHKVRSLPGSFT